MSGYNLRPNLLEDKFPAARRSPARRGAGRGFPYYPVRLSSSVSSQRIKEGESALNRRPAYRVRTPLTRSQISALLKQSGKSIRATLPPRGGDCSCLRRTRLPRSQSYIGDTTSRFREHHLAGERVSTRVVLICRSFAAAKFKLAIRMRRPSRPWIAWMEYFGSRCWPLRGARKLLWSLPHHPPKLFRRRVRLTSSSSHPANLVRKHRLEL